MALVLEKEKMLRSITIDKAAKTTSKLFMFDPWSRRGEGFISSGEKSVIGFTKADRTIYIRDDVTTAGDVTVTEGDTSDYRGLIKMLFNAKGFYGI